MFTWNSENMAIVLFGVLGLILLIVGGSFAYLSDGSDSVDPTMSISFTTIGTVFLVVSMAMFARKYYYSEEKVLGRRTTADRRAEERARKEQEDVIGLKKHH